jgi:uncharacterized membrane protein
MDDLTVIFIVFISVGMVEIILGLPLLFNKIKPNWFYGFRLPSTVSNEKVWYKINQYFGRDMIISGIIIVLLTFFLMLFKLNLLIIEIFTFLIVILHILIITIIVRAYFFLKSIKN